jgi:SAM-dependent methyltransferase/glycosyltransferase involved in cell wall biosynthesis
MTPAHEVLAIARRRAQWAGEEFPRLYPNTVWLRPTGSRIWHALSLPTILWRALRGRPRAVLFATTSGVNRIVARALRVLGVEARTLTFDQFLSPATAADFDAIAVYSAEETARYAPEVRAKCRETLYPAKAEPLGLTPVEGDYVFASGNHGRDWATFAEAARLCPEVRFVVVTANEIAVALPENCDRRAPMPEADYYRLMSGARLVALPLKESLIPHGQCDAASAAWLGKAVVSTAGATVDAYARPEHAILVPARDAAALAAAVREVWSDGARRAALSAGALARRADLSRAAFFRRVAEEIDALVATPRPQDAREVCGDEPLSARGRLRFLGWNALRNVAGSIARLAPRRRSPARADATAASPMRAAVDAFVVEELPALLPAREISVLDIGGGSGYARELLARAGYRGRYLAVDPVPDARFEARANLAFEARQVAEPFERFASDERFDLVLSVTALEHVPGVDAAVRNAARHLAPGGAEVHVVPGGWALPVYLWHGYRQFSRGRLRDLFGDAEVYALGGLATLLLQLLWCTVPERLTASDRLRRTRAYRGLRRACQRIDRYLPICPIAYAAVRRA